jgi:hypothetical protein
VNINRLHRFHKGPTTSALWGRCKGLNDFLSTSPCENMKDVLEVNNENFMLDSIRISGGSNLARESTGLKIRLSRVQIPSPSLMFNKLCWE